MLYLFAGLPRDGDLRYFLERWCDAHAFELILREVDVKRSPNDDLSQSSPWENIFSELRAGQWDILICSPPCGTYSRARHRSVGNGSGPVPLRNCMHPWGFPWLSESNAALVKLANYFVKQCLEAIGYQCAANRFYIWEHPEDLGVTETGDVPASIWQLAEIRSLEGFTWAVHQCAFGALHPKPTRFLSNLPLAEQWSNGWPTFDADGRYTGPLTWCNHDWHESMMGWDVSSGTWRTAGSECYPPLLCSHLVDCITSSQKQTDLPEAPADAETLAQSLLHRMDALAPDDLQPLAELLPREATHKAAGHQGEGAFFAGAYARGGFVGLRSSCHSSPCSIKVLTAALRGAFPGHCFSTLVVFTNTLTAPHKDVHNAPFPNLLMSLSKFTAGQVWREDSEGDVYRTVAGQARPGRLLDVAAGPCLLDAHKYLHATEPWRGCRIVLVGFMVRHLLLLSPEQVALLAALGFVLPDADRARMGEHAPASVMVQKASGAAEANPSTKASQEVIMVDSGDELPEETADTELPFDPRTSRAFGQPLVCRHDTGKRVFVDGFGLCSPGRWPPGQRGQLNSWEESLHAERMQRILRNFVLAELPDIRKSAFLLAAGRLESSPFTQSALDRLRGELAGTLPDPALALRVPDRQPFLLYMLAQSLRILGDPDWEILIQGTECFAEGVPLGDEEPLPRTPQVFARREKFRKLDASPFQAIMDNYTSAELSSEQLEEHFRADEQKGRMLPTTEGAVAQEYGPGRLLVAAMGAVEKPNGDIRPLHDGTHGVNLNNRIRILDKLETPGPDEVLEMVSLARDSGEAVFAISADISQAHRQVKVRRKDWPKMGCRSSSTSRTVWLNTVGTFGISSAAYWWSRLFGCIGRWVLRILTTLWHMEVVYVDDLHLVTAGDTKFLVLWMALAAYEAIGTPFAYHKFKGGIKVDFVGYHIAYDQWSAGLSSKRTKWIVGWINDLEAASWMVVGRAMVEFTGRMTFVGRLLLWLKPFLAPLHSWCAVLARGTTARVPTMVYLSLIYIRKNLLLTHHLVPALRQAPFVTQSFRTDAKCERGRVVLGGWSLAKGNVPGKADWFSVEVTPTMAPWLFKEDGASEWASASAELLASYLALFAFGHLQAAGCRNVMLQRSMVEQTIGRTLRPKQKGHLRSGRSWGC